MLILNMFHKSESEIAPGLFFIKGGDTSFTNRQKNIFEVLNAVEIEQSVRVPTSRSILQPDPDPMDIEPLSSVRAVKRKRKELTQFRGKESIFKRPDAPRPTRFVKTKTIPDYHKNPHKWVKYSLDDVSPSDMSDRSNTAAAFSFLEELAARKASAEMEDMEVEQSSTQIAFRRPKGKTRLTIGSVVVDTSSSPTAENSKPSFRSGKLVMPEYVVGQRKKKEKKSELLNSSVKTSKTKEIQLGHLMAEEDDSNE